jgi:hypothetical protein
MARFGATMAMTAILFSVRVISQPLIFYNDIFDITGNMIN